MTGVEHWTALAPALQNSCCWSWPRDRHSEDGMTADRDDATTTNRNGSEHVTDADGRVSATGRSPPDGPPRLTVLGACARHSGTLKSVAAVAARFRQGHQLLSTEAIFMFSTARSPKLQSENRMVEEIMPDQGGEGRLRGLAHCHRIRCYRNWNSVTGIPPQLPGASRILPNPRGLPACPAQGSVRAGDRSWPGGLPASGRPERQS